MHSHVRENSISENLTADISAQLNDVSIAADTNTAAGFKFHKLVEMDDLMLSSQDQVISTTLDGLIKERQDWEAKEYFQSTERLYSLLTDCYSVFKSMNGTSSEAIVARKSFDRVIKVRGYNFRDTMHLLVQVIRVVFDSESRRTSKYASALRIASEKGVAVNDLKDFLYGNGGIEEVSRLNKNADLPRHLKGKAVLYGRYITTIEDEDLLDHFEMGDYEDAVLFLATYKQESKSFDILSVIQRKTAIKAAFTSLASEVNASDLAALKADLAIQAAKVETEKAAAASKAQQPKTFMV